jgi:hypothetical protein
MLHQKGENIPSLSTAEAIVDLLLRTDHKGRSLLLVERTESLIILSRRFQGKVCGNNLDNIAPVLNLLDYRLWNTTHKENLLS